MTLILSILTLFASVSTCLANSLDDFLMPVSSQSERQNLRVYKLLCTRNDGSNPVLEGLEFRVDSISDHFSLLSFQTDSRASYLNLFLLRKNGDNCEIHRKFKPLYQGKFDLIARPGGTTLRTYQALVEFFTAPPYTYYLEDYEWSNEKNSWGLKSSGVKEVADIRGLFNLAGFESSRKKHPRAAAYYMLGFERLQKSDLDLDITLRAQLQFEMARSMALSGYVIRSRKILKHLAKKKGPFQPRAQKALRMLPEE